MINNSQVFITDLGRYNDFYIDIVDKCKNILDNFLIDYSIYYPRSITLEHIALIAQDKNKNILIFQNEHTILQQLDFFKQLPNKKIILFTDIANLETDIPNLKIIHWGGFILHQQEEYYNITPHKTKNFNSSAHWISLSHGTRLHRVLAAIFLLGKNLNKFGTLRISPHTATDKNIKSWQDLCQVEKNTIPQEFLSRYDMLMSNGLIDFKNIIHDGQPVNNPYDGLVGVDNAGNFDKNLRSLYENSFVEIVNETLFFEDRIIVTEKIKNAIYGFNLPIILSSRGYVQHLRNIGFDMFDDFINHNYDTIHDPFWRIATAINDNEHLLSDPTFAKEAWQKCYHRMEKNYRLARVELATYHQTNCINEFTTACQEFLLQH